MKKRLYVQLWVAVLLTIAGVSLLFMGFWVNPTGNIDSSVLVAFGEISTFAGALFGVDYKYALREKKSLDHDKRTTQGDNALRNDGEH